MHTFKSTLILIRGVSGVGKTTLANSLETDPSSQNDFVIAADDYFTSPDTGVYDFRPSLLPAAHRWCLVEAKNHLSFCDKVIVHNTFTCRWEMEPYLKFAGQNGHEIIVIDLFTGYNPTTGTGYTATELHARCTHGVPLEGIQAQIERYELDWRSADPRPVWER